jgi:hypothetical protein
MAKNYSYVFPCGTNYSHYTKYKKAQVIYASSIAHISFRKIHHTKGTRETPEWHPRLAESFVMGPK